MIPSMFAVLALASADVAHAERLQPPEGRQIRVAVVLTERAVVIDYAGPWEVFENVHVGGGDMRHQMPFELYTVGRDRKPIHTSGGMKPGMTIVPDYGFADAPAPDIVVVGAQSGDAQLGPWLRKVHSQHALIMSVCTGAFRVAQAGLLDGKPATTHHSSLQRLANQYPGISVRSSVRYVESDPRILTAGGLSSGIDSALHVVELYYGAEVAQATADYMEYQGQGWKTNRGAGESAVVPPTIPLADRAHETLWRGTILPAYPKPEPQMSVVLHPAGRTAEYLERSRDVEDLHIGVSQHHHVMRPSPERRIAGSHRAGTTSFCGKAVALSNVKGLVEPSWVVRLPEIRSALRVPENSNGPWSEGTMKWRLP